MKTIYYLLVFLWVNSVNAQLDYTLPLTIDSTTIKSTQYDFSAVEQPLSPSQNVNLLSNLIQLLDTSSCYFFTAYDSFSEFISDSAAFAANLPEELVRNSHLLDLNGDSIPDYLYDRLNFQWDVQGIYMLLSTENGWKIQRLPGNYIINVNWENGRLKSYETFQWACCDFWFERYYFIEQLSDTIKSISETGIVKDTEIPEKLEVDTTRQFITTTDSTILYAMIRGKIKPAYTASKILKGAYITEKEFDNKMYYFVRLEINEEKFGLSGMNYLIGWVEKETIEFENN